MSEQKRVIVMSIVVAEHCAGGQAFDARLMDFMVGEVTKQLAAKKDKTDIRTLPKYVESGSFC